MSEVKKLLEPLFEKANKEKLWFYSNYQGMWFSPKELKKEQDSGRLLWGPVNWQLREPPKTRDSALEKAKIDIENEKLIKRIESGWDES